VGGCGGVSVWVGERVWRSECVGGLEGVEGRALARVKEESKAAGLKKRK
jgi:hypothetical protein